MEDEKKLHLGHRRRMREIAFSEGLDSFNEHQVLEMLLFFAIPNGDTNPTAHRLIERFGSLRGVLEADREELTRVKGIGESAANLIRFSQLFAGRYLRAASFGENDSFRFSDSDAARRYYEGVFLGEKEEQVRAMAVTEELRLIKEALLVKGTFGRVELSARKMADFALRNGCDRLILAHNHPNGSAIPSPNDVRANARYARLLYELDIMMLDHIIVGKTGSVSLRSSRVGQRAWPDQNDMRNDGEGSPCPDEEEGPLDTPELDAFAEELSRLLDTRRF